MLKRISSFYGMVKTNANLLSSKDVRIQNLLTTLKKKALLLYIMQPDA